MSSCVSNGKRLIFSKRLHELRIRNSLTFKRLSSFSGIPASTIATWERGTAYPSDSFAVTRLAFIFNVPSSYLLGEEDK